MTNLEADYKRLKEKYEELKKNNIRITESFVSTNKGLGDTIIDLQQENTSLKQLKQRVEETKIKYELKLNTLGDYETRQEDRRVMFLLQHLLNENEALSV